MKQERTFQVETEQQRDMLSRFALRQPLPFQAAFGPLRSQRSLPQNARLWKLHSLASEVTGYTPEELHEEMLCAHFGYSERERTNPWTGEIEIKRVPLKRSSVRDTKEFAAFMEFVENFYGATLGVWLGGE